MLHDGLKNTSPAPTDKSMTTPPAGRVNDSPTRDDVAKSSPGLGPRTA